MFKHFKTSNRIKEIERNKQFRPQHCMTQCDISVVSTSTKSKQSKPSKARDPLNKFGKYKPPPKERAQVHSADGEKKTPVETSTQQPKPLRTEPLPYVEINFKKIRL